MPRPSSLKIINKDIREMAAIVYIEEIKGDPKSKNTLEC